MDVNTKRLKKNAFRVTKERGLTASRVRVPGGHLALHGLLYDNLRRDIPAQVDDLITVIFQQNLHDVLADIMDVTFHRCQDDGSFLFPGLSASIHSCLDDLKCGLGSLRAHKKLGQEHGALLKPLSHTVQGRYHLAVDDIKRFPLL